jgi:ceramide glucosyltransferase
MTARLGENLLAWFAQGCALAALVGVALLALNIVALLRRPRTWPAASPTEPVTVLVPLCGDEVGLYARLAALCRQAYAGPAQFVFGVSSPSDPAIAVAGQLACDFPTAEVDLVIDSRSHGSNRKISNLVNMLERARHDTLVFVDSDILVGPDHLTRIVSELRRPGTGAVTCLYYGVAGQGRWAALSAMSINVHFLPDALLGLWLRMAEPCFGATIAISRRLLDRVGGLGVFGGCLYDDYAIGAAVRATGQRVAISSLVVGHVCLERSPGELVDTQLRRARTIRMINPIGYAGSLVTHPTALALLASLLGDPRGLPILAAAAGLRLAECVSIERAFSLPRHQYLNLLLRDVLAFGVYLTAFFGDEVAWRGARYRTSRRGTLLANS